MHVTLNTRFQIFKVGTLGASFLLALSGCNADLSPGRVYSPGQSQQMKASGLVSTDWSDQWWLDKTSRALRGGDPVAANENRDALLGAGKGQVVDEFMADPRFADTILDFSLMYIGFKQDLIKTPQMGYLAPVYHFPQAILASREVANDGDFFKLFTLKQSIYMFPLQRPASSNPGDAPLSDSVLREKIFQEMQSDLSNMIALATARPTDVNDLCADFKAHLLRFIDVDLLRVTDDIPYDVFYSSDYYGGPSQYCDARPTGGYNFVANLTAIRAKNETFFNLLRPLDASVYHPTTVGDIRTFDFSTLAPSYSYTAFTPQSISRALQNSSTNYDRKRSAYILKRFLCDDLTPINVENPSVHAGDVHGSNPSCFACHYKLDPMAGFFRLYGGGFQDFSQRDTLSFDDNASVPIVDYVKAWSGTDPAHALNVGYIRSTEDLSQNSYGSSLDDLLNLLKTAPEAKRCLMRRSYEYLVASDQTIDGGFLDYLTEQFDRVSAQQGSMAALKNTFKTIVLGSAFAIQDPNRDSCYDFRPGAAPQNGVPCKVSSILTQNCVHCHSGTSGAGHLDLSHWQPLSGTGGGFPHLQGGTATTSAVTFQAMLDRISSTDPDERMPYLSDMPSQDRQQLYTWLNQLLNGGSP